MKIKRTGSSEYGRRLKMMVAGAPGAGKTLMSSTSPDVLFASAESGLMSVADQNVPYVEIVKFDDLKKLRDLLDQKPKVREELLGVPVETVVVDTLDEVQRILIRERLANEKKENLDFRDWGYVGEQMTNVIAGFRDLDLHVIFTVHTKETKDDETGRILIRPQLQGQISEQVPGAVDVAALLQVETETIRSEKGTDRKRVRRLHTQPMEKADWVKDRSGKLPEYFEVNFKDDFSRIHEAIFSHVDLKDSEVVADTDDTVEEAVPDEPDLSDLTVQGGETVPVDCPKEEPCAKMVSEDQADLSRIKLRKVVCRDCYKEMS